MTSPTVPLAGRPLAAQYLASILHRLPAEAIARPGSAAMRAALCALASETGLLPTRSETRAAMRHLVAAGLVERPDCER